MRVLNVRNVQVALPAAIDLLLREGEDRESRNGPVRVVSGPVTTHYTRPTERVLFWPERDANPFFHLFEALWMLAGRNDIAFLTQFAANMANYSDDGVTQHGAYGHRWRNWFGRDQLLWLIDRLKKDPNDRRAMLGMYDPRYDQAYADKGGKDVPCNTTVMFGLAPDGALDMTVTNRSNDIIWGCYGANAVHFSVLQEFVASSLGRDVGHYWQVSNNWHGYHKTLMPLADLAMAAPDPFRSLEANDFYAQGVVSPFPLCQTDAKTWLMDLALFLEDPTAIGYRDPFFRRVAVPMWMAHQAYKQNQGEEKYTRPLEILQQCRATDWRKASEEWIMRRYAKYKVKEAAKNAEAAE